MRDRIVALIVDEGKWLTASMGFALMAVTVLLYRHRGLDCSVRQRVSAAMNLFCGVTIGVMAFGHLLAVSTKLGLGTLVGSIPAFYAIGTVLAIPSWWLIYHARRIPAADDDHGHTAIALNAALIITLLALGLHNLPLAAPPLLNIAYHLHSRRVVGWVIVGLAVVVNVGLFVGSLIFLASGKSFEQFRGIE